MNRLSTLDRVIAGCALVAFISLFLPWYGVTVGQFSVAAEGWSAGFAAWAGALLLTAAGILVVIPARGGVLSGGRVGPSTLVAGIAALGLLLVIVRWVSFPRAHSAGLSYDVGARYGIYIALIAGIVEVVAAVMAMRASGEQMPWAQAEHRPEPADTSPETPAAPEE